MNHQEGDALIPKDPIPESNFNAGARESILRRFEAWLNEALANQEVPDGINAEILTRLSNTDDENTMVSPDNRCDLYSLWSAFTTLSQEVKIQGRTFKQLSDTLAPFSEMTSSLNMTLRDQKKALEEMSQIADGLRDFQAEREREAASKAEKSIQREFLEILIDIRDRLVRGLKTVDNHLQQVRKFDKGSWLSRFFRRYEEINHLQEAASSIEKGYILGLERLEETLERLGVQAIECDGGLFDPRLMNAVDIENRSDIPDGTVVEIYRTGYEWRGAVFRPAEVKVARNTL